MVIKKVIFKIIFSNHHCEDSEGPFNYYVIKRVDGWNRTTLWIIKCFLHQSGWVGPHDYGYGLMIMVDYRVGGWGGNSPKSWLRNIWMVPNYGCRWTFKNWIMTEEAWKCYAKSHQSGKVCYHRPRNLFHNIISHVDISSKSVKSCKDNRQINPGQKKGPP